MRTKRGGYKPTKPKQGKPRVRIRASGSTPKPVDTVTLKAIGPGWRTLGPERPLEPMHAGLYRFLGAPLWA